MARKWLTSPQIFTGETYEGTLAEALDKFIGLEPDGVRGFLKSVLSNWHGEFPIPVWAQNLLEPLTK